MTRNRDGFTLVELIVVSVLGVIVLSAALQVLITNQRTYTAQSATIEGQQASRMAIEVMFNELRELSPADGDIISMGPSSLQVRLMRKFGIACEVDVGPTASPPRIRVLDNTGDDFAVADDTVLVFADNREATGSDDKWLRVGLVDVDNTVTCLGRPAMDLEVDTAGGLFVNDTVRVGAPVRAYQDFTYGTSLWLYPTTPYLTRNGTPIAGPLRYPGTDGLQFIYRDALGNITTTPTDVRQIEVRIRTGERVMGPGGDMVSDSLDTWIYTRN